MTVHIDPAENEMPEDVQVIADYYEDRLAAVRAQRDQARAALDRVRALHRPWYEIDGVRHDNRVVVYGDDVPADHVCVKAGDRADQFAFEQCTIEDDEDDSEHYVLACYECRCTTEEGEPGYLLWPCATARALDGPAPVEDGGQR